jgi:molecular chaperone GrpE
VDDPPDPSADERYAVTLRAIDDGLRAFHQRAAHREAVIDRLHEENQLLREGQRRSLLQPVLVDLLNLYDGLFLQVRRLAGVPERAAEQALFESFADDVAMALERCGATITTAEPGEPYERGRHVASGFAQHTDPGADGTVAEMLAVGLVDQENGQIRRPVRVRLYRAVAPEQLRAGSPEQLRAGSVE